MVIRNIFLTLIGIGFLALAFIGFLIPILPGFLFLIPALLCFAAVSPAVNRSLQRNRTWRALHSRWRRGSGLPLASRLKLMFWMGADTALRTLQPRKRG